MRHETATTFTVSPGTGTYWQEMKRPSRIVLMVIALIALVVELVAGWYSFEQDDPGSGIGYLLIIGAFTVVVIALAVAYSLLFYRNSRLVLTPSEIVHRNWRGRTRSMPRNRVAGITKARYLSQANAGVKNQDVLTVIAAADGSTISFSTGFWPEEEMVELWRRLGAPCEQWLHPVVPTMKEFRRYHRQVRLPIYHRHFTGFTVSMTILVSLLLIAVLMAVAFTVDTAL